MTYSEFDRLCSEMTIAPSIALENDEVKEALLRRDDDAVREALTDNF